MNLNVRFAAKELWRLHIHAVISGTMAGFPGWNAGGINQRLTNMKTNLLVTTTAMALLLGTGLAMAQKGAESGGHSSSSPAMSAPSASGGSESRGATEGSATTDRKGASAESKGAAHGKSAQSSSSEHMSQKGADSSAGSKMDSKSDTSRTGSNTRMDSNNKAESSNKAQSDTKTQAQGSSEKTQGSSGRTQAQGSSGSSPNRAESTSERSNNDRNASSNSSQTNVQLSSEQRTKIHETVIKQSNAPRISRNEINFSLSVGTVIPRSVHVATLPPAVVEIHPQWRGYEYVLVGDEIVILEPSSLRIVAIITA
jgi:hypothetical protein